MNRATYAEFSPKCRGDLLSMLGTLARPLAAGTPDLRREQRLRASPSFTNSSTAAPAAPTASSNPYPELPRSSATPSPPSPTRARQGVTDDPCEVEEMVRLLKEEAVVILR